MNILLINHYAGSPEMGMEFRPYYFAREWVKMGHKVDIIAADYSHLRRKNPEVEKDFQTEVIDGINYHWIKTNTYEGNGVSRAITMAQFVGKLWLNAKKIVREFEPDVVICSSTYPIDTFVGQRIRKVSKKKVKLIHEVHDMWPLSPIEIGGMSPRNPFIVAMQIGENSFCKNSDIVVSLLPAAKNYFIEHGMREDKFRHISNGVLLDEWESYDKVPQNISEHFMKNHEAGKFNLCFFGSLHKTYNLDVLIKAIIEMNSNDISLTLIGPGHDKNELKRLSVGYEDKITFFDPIPKKSIPDLFNYIDATFIGIKSQKLLKYGVCMNKLFDSMMGGRPILFMAKTPNNIVDEYECGIVIEEESEEALIKGIEYLISLDHETICLYGENGRRAAQTIYNYKDLAKEFEKVMIKGV